jgi:hypothetical protein
MKQLFILFFVLLGAINGRAQTLENFRSVNNIRAMAIDAQGNKWLGTQRGLFKYDGTNFTQYTTQNGLYQNLVGGIAIDAQGILWLANGALTRFDGTTFTHYTEASTDTYTANEYDRLMRPPQWHNRLRNRHYNSCAAFIPNSSAKHA